MRTPTDRGFTLLETVLAVTLVSMIAASIAMTYSALQRQRVIEQQRLGAAELANRLILQYLDARNALPSELTPLEYDAERYRWSLDAAQIEFTPAVVPERDRSRAVSLERISQVTVRVWLVDENDAPLRFSPILPSAVVSRLRDPLALSNPDSLENALETPEGRADFVRELMNIEDGTAPGAGGER